MSSCYLLLTVTSRGILLKFQMIHNLLNVRFHYEKHETLMFV